MTMTRTAVPTVWPTLLYRDARAALTFLVDVFGFTERVVHADGDAVHHAELLMTTPEGGVAGGIMLGSATPEGTPDCDTDGARAGSGSVHVVVTDPDERYARAVAAGTTIVREIEDTDYGSRQFVAKDPEGNVWSFGTWYE
ncbi:VOC family protein [Pseudonocardia sp. GCM10023141]|uniref:VOC family protein n=1 Tax=Pseudonocardia sp. GCM10023141 TaxID=3252653 RepID=UPI0036159694